MLARAKRSLTRPLSLFLRAFAPSREHQNIPDEALRLRPENSAPHPKFVLTRAIHGGPRILPAMPARTVGFGIPLEDRRECSRPEKPRARLMRRQFTADCNPAAGCPLPYARARSCLFSRLFCRFALFL
jgi:hypothetical protein